MRVFITGATGFIGSAIVKELIGAGHQVVGLARSDAAAAALTAAGAEAHRGDLADLDSLRSGAAASDGVIHAGFVHDFSRFKEMCEIDRRAIEALGDALRGTDRPLIVTSGTALVDSNNIATEESEANATSTPRIATEEAAAAAAERGARVTVLRLPPSVHGDGDHGFVALLAGIAREKGASAYIDDGANRWPAVHRLDAARLYRLALEKAPAVARLHGVGEEGVAFRSIAEVIGKRLNLPVVSKHADEAADHFGWFALSAGLDNPTSSRRTQDLLDWHPEQPGLIADIDREGYLSVQTAIAG